MGRSAPAIAKCNPAVRRPAKRDSTSVSAQASARPHMKSTSSRFFDSVQVTEIMDANSAGLEFSRKTRNSGYSVANGEERLRNAFRAGLFLSTALALGGLPGCDVGGSITSSHEPSNDGVVPPTGAGGELATVTFAESSASPVNPERGFYVGVDLLGGAGGAAGVRDGGHALAIALVRLDAYRSQPLDAGRALRRSHQARRRVDGGRRPAPARAGHPVVPGPTVPSRAPPHR